MLVGYIILITLMGIGLVFTIIMVGIAICFDKCCRSQVPESEAALANVSFERTFNTSSEIV